MLTDKLQLLLQFRFGLTWE